MKVCIYGAGAIGGYLAAGLSAVHDVELSLVARGPHLAAIQKNGLKLLIKGEERLCAPRATNDPAELGPQDYVIVCLKAHQAWESAEHMRPLLGDDNVPFFNALSASIMLAVMVLPTIASVSEDAMSSVPRDLREAAYGLGATRLEVAFRVVFPAALSGIIASTNCCNTSPSNFL